MNRFLQRLAGVALLATALGAHAQSEMVSGLAGRLAKNVATQSVTVTANQTAAITAQGAISQYLSKPGVTGQSIYTGICAGCTSFDNHQSVLTVPVGSTVTTLSGYGSYINDLAAGGTNGNPVNYFSVATCSGTNASCWGQNPVLMDNTTYALSSVTGVKLIGAEYDFDVTSTSTTVQGPNLLGSSLAQPAYAAGFTVGSLSVQSPGLAKWTNAFVTGNGVAATAANWGAAAASGTNIASQPVLQTYFDASGTARAWQTQVGTNGNLTLTDTGSGHQFQTNSGFIAKAASGSGSVTVDNSATGNQSVTLYNDNGTNKWQVGKDASNAFFAYDNAAGAYVWSMSTGGALTVTPQVALAKAEIDKGYGYATPTSGATLTMTATQQTEIVHATATLASLTITLPACATDGQIARFSADVAITALTVNATSGSVAAAPTTLAAGAGHGYLCHAANTTWEPLY